MGYLLLEEDLFVKQSIINHHSPEGQKIHNFLLARAKLLAGNKIDLEKNPIAFVLSDVMEPNAFYAPSPQEHGTPQRNEYKNIRYTKNPLNIPVICVTKGLIDMVDNIDQLDYALAHELTHLIIRGYGIKRNSKGEELLSNLHAVDLVYDAGSDPKQTLTMEDKLHEYAKKHAEEVERKRRRRHSHEKETGINWSEILDVHVTHRNTRTALEASLTRLSHLIDHRVPSEIDKSVFAVEYSDPVTEFLKANGYESQNALGKLRVLIDCIDHLSTRAPSPEEYYQAKLATLEEQGATINPEDWEATYDLTNKKKRIQQEIDEGYKGYFSGLTIEKKYQQKIAALAEDVFEQAYNQRKEKRRTKHLPAINVRDIDVYLQNKAYRHIKENGYPEEESPMFFDASGIMYTYFYNLLGNHLPYDRGSRNTGQAPLRVLPQIEIDLETAKQRILDAQEITAFVKAKEDFKKLTKTYKDLSSISYGNGHLITKLDNLSFIDGHHNGHTTFERLYPRLETGAPVPWNNLVEIAKTDDEACAHVVNFLNEHGIKDYRITHGQRLVQRDTYSCYSVNDEGILLHEKYNYDLDYAIRTDLVLQSYDYIKSYFEDELALFESTCNSVLSLTNTDFITFDEKDDQWDRVSIAHTKAMNFVQLYNSLPQDDDNEDNRRRRLDNNSVLFLISGQHLNDHPLPCSDKKGRPTLDDALFEFNNPVFQKHFGKDFKNRVTEKKSLLKQKMFTTALDVVKYAADIWAEASPNVKELDHRRSALWDQKHALEKNDPANEEIEKSINTLYKEQMLHQAKRDTAENIVLNYTCSLIESKDYEHLIKRLSPQQKDVLADYIIRDEKGIFVRMLEPRRYSAFCDFRHVLPQQIERIVSGNYALTDTMQTVSSNLGYKKANTKEELNDFVHAHLENRWHVSKYVWYLHVFDTMQHLETSPTINLDSMAKAMANIEVANPSDYSMDSSKLAEEAFQTYVKLIKESHVPSLIAKAIDFSENYVGLSVDQLIETVDSLVSLRKRMARLLEIKSSHECFDKERGYYTEVKDETDPKHRSLLDIFDKNIQGSLRQAELQALQKDNALEKIIDLFRLYHAQDRESSHERTRSTYLATIVKEDNSLEKIAALSKNKGFWPEDVLDHVKAYVFAKNTFLNDIVFENKLLNDILNKLETLPSSEKKDQCLFILLDKSLRAPYPETRERLFTLYSDAVLTDLGKDDGSQNYRDKLARVIKALDNDNQKDWDIGKKHGGYGNLLSNSLSAADKYVLLRRVSDNILSQEETSDLIKMACQINLKSEDLVKSYLYGVGVDYLTAEMDNDPNTAKKFIQFLNSKGESLDCDEMSAYIRETISNEERNNVYRYGINEILENTKPINCKVLYENFWSAPLEARAVIIARILKCACNGQTESENKSQQSWERVFDLVMDNLISPDDTSVESRYARDVMHSYIKARSNYERDIILSAMMVANRNIGADAGNVGKALKLFLENMGPAEIKLGQAISSHPNTPESIRNELQDLKNMADVPPRWALYEWIRTENIPEQLWKDKYLGDVLGSASYYTTIALGDNDVLRILRPEAREKAAKGFKVICDTVTDLQEKDRVSDLDYRELTTSVAEMVAQAARMSKIETDQEIGQKQYEYAQEIYNSVKISSGTETFSLRVMDWKARGQNWVIMHRARGPIFNDLPEDTPEQITYKKNFAKAYIVFEMRQILSGQKFDHDKHGAQLCIDTETNEVGLFDTGAMALREPTIEEQKQLGHVLYGIVKSLNSKKNGATSSSRIDALDPILSDKIEELHKANSDPQYLVEVKKGVLALGDFFRALDESDIKNLVFEINIYSHISEPTKEELLKRMSLSEKAQLKIFLAGYPLSKGKDTIVIGKARSEITGNVASFSVSPFVPNKSDWFQQAFANSNNKDGEDECLKSSGNHMRLAPSIPLARHP